MLDHSCYNLMVAILQFPAYPMYSDHITSNCQANEVFYLVFDRSSKYIGFELKKYCSKGMRAINHVFGLTKCANSVKKISSCVSAVACTYKKGSH